MCACLFASTLMKNARNLVSRTQVEFATHGARRTSILVCTTYQGGENKRGMPWLPHGKADLNAPSSRAFQPSTVFHLCSVVGLPRGGSLTMPKMGTTFFSAVPVRSMRYRRPCIQWMSNVFIAGYLTLHRSTRGWQSLCFKVCRALLARSAATKIRKPEKNSLVTLRTGQRRSVC